MFDTINIIISILFAVVGCLFWLLGLFVFISELSDKGERLGKSVMTLCISVISFGFFGLICNLPGMTTPIYSRAVTYVPPTSIVKVDNVTVVSHIANGKSAVTSFVSHDAKYWNATNIMVKVTSGNNFFGRKITPEYEVVLQ